jgi:hypothetical protein
MSRSIAAAASRTRQILVALAFALFMPSVQNCILLCSTELALGVVVVSPRPTRMTEATDWPMTEPSLSPTILAVE